MAGVLSFTTTIYLPAHVHVIGADGEAVFFLNCPEGPPELRESYSFSISQVNRIQRELAAILPSLCAAWGKMHGHY